MDMSAEEFARRAKQKPGKSQCPDCMKWFDEGRGLGQHWDKTDCSVPNLTEKQKEIAVGLLMGDGSISNGKNRDVLRVKMITEDFIEWLDNEFEIMSTGMKEISQESNHWSDKTQYKVTIRACETVDELSEWYSSGSKIFPDDIELTPLTLKVWYVCDGWLSQNNEVNISCLNESDNKGKIADIFRRVGLPKPDRWDGDPERNMSMHWNKKHSKALWGYMGEPLPGFGYKWPD